MQLADEKSVLVIIDCYLGPSGWIESTIGYRIGTEQLFRLHDETNQELEDRASATIRAQAPRDGLALRLNPIKEG